LMGLAKGGACTSGLTRAERGAWNFFGVSQETSHPGRFDLACFGRLVLFCLVTRFIG